MKNAKPFKGEVRLNDSSSFRKTARAFQRGKLSPERLGTIDIALKSADRRRVLYMNSHARNAQ